jgi:hypothetical protein
MGADRLWIMIDVETSGPIYGHHSLTEIGAVVGSRARGVIDRFGALVKPIGEHAVASRDSFARAQVHGVPPKQAMCDFAAWCRPYLDAKATFVARPAAFDWPWIVFYAWTYLGENPFGFKATCASAWFESRGKKFRVQIPHEAIRDAEIQLEHFLGEV